MDNSRSGSRLSRRRAAFAPAQIPPTPEEFRERCSPHIDSSRKVLFACYLHGRPSFSRLNSISSSSRKNRLNSERERRRQFSCILLLVKQGYTNECESLAHVSIFFARARRRSTRRERTLVPANYFLVREAIKLHRHFLRQLSITSINRRAVIISFTCDRDIRRNFNAETCLRS